MENKLKTEYTINGINFEYTTYENIDQEELRKLSRKVAYIKRYAEGLHNVLLNEKYNTSRTEKHKTPNYYIEAIKMRLGEVEEELKKYEK